MRLRLRPAGLAALVLASAFSLAPALAQTAPAFQCKVASIASSDASLGAMTARISAKLPEGQPVRILAIGSSSTEGVGASSKDKAYPARLQAALGDSWKGVKTEVVNAGIGGETVPETILRLRKALKEQPFDLVIWQVGTNDALRGGDLGTFRALLSSGIAAARQSGSEIVLLDQQYFPAVKDPAAYKIFVDAVAQMGRDEKVPVLSRFAAMTEWYSRDAKAFAATLSGDNFHMSDVGYDCLSRDIAASLVAMTTPARQRVAQGGNVQTAAR